MEVDIKAEIKKYQAELLNLEGQLHETQIKVQVLSNACVMRQGIVAYLQLLDGQEEAKKMLNAIINPPGLPT